MKNGNNNEMKPVIRRKAESWAKHKKKKAEKDITRANFSSFSPAFSFSSGFQRRG